MLLGNDLLVLTLLLCSHVIHELMCCYTFTLQNLWIITKLQSSVIVGICVFNSCTYSCDENVMIQIQDLYITVPLCTLCVLYGIGNDAL